jgi:phospho-N-acetylmuramoyl-pentapeptide-transferase
VLYYLSQQLLDWSAGTAWEDPLSGLRVFRYVTFRTAGAAVTALGLSLLLGPAFIRWLRRVKFGQHYDDAAAQSGGRTERERKRGTPTMGGLLMVVAIDLTALLWTQWNSLVVLTLVSLVGLAALGFYDDYAKIAFQNPKGVHARVKLIVQFVLAGFVALYLWWQPETRRLVTDINVPFLKEPVWRGAAVAGILLTVLVIVGSSNAVNLTDGMDGLAIGCTLIVTAAFLVFTYAAGHAVIANYLMIPHVPGASELTVICAAVFGAALGFLWFNCHPADVFMGDTGSLAIGGVLGIMAVLIHQPLLLFIAGGVFVAEAGSVLLQVGYFRYHKRFHGVDKRLFRMTPLHHHFELLQWPETKIVTRFYIVCVVCVVVALASLKLR